MSTYEAKVNGLENEIETQKELYEKKLLEFAQRFVRQPQMILDGCQAPGQGPGHVLVKLQVKFPV